MLRHASPSTTAGGSADASGTHPAVTRRREAVHIRNYDHLEGHSVNIRIETVGGQPIATERHYLLPGQSAWAVRTLRAGDYRVRVRVDGVERHRLDCRLDGTAAGTALVELGNGVVSVTTGEAPAPTD